MCVDFDKNSAGKKWGCKIGGGELGNIEEEVMCGDEMGLICRYGSDFISIVFRHIFLQFQESPKLIKSYICHMSACLFN